MEKTNNRIADRRIRKTRLLLRQGLSKLLSEKDINKITVKELVDKIDINRSTFYLHCKDLHDLLSQIEDDMMLELTEILEAFSTEEISVTMIPYLEAILKYLSINTELCLALLGENGDIAFINKLKKAVMTDCFKNIKQIYSKANPKYYEIYAQYSVSGCIGVIQNWLENGQEEDVSQIALILDKIIQCSLKALNE